MKVVNEHYRTSEELHAGLAATLVSPKDNGRLELIVRRPAVGVREVLVEGELDLETGLIGDTWNVRASSRSRDKSSPHPDLQLTLMNSRVATLIAGDRTRWPLAGDQLYVDFDLSEANGPPGTRLQIGSSVVEITAQPHTGCGKFVKQFGVDAMKFVNSPRGRELHLRGINARVVRAGVIRTGDVVKKVTPGAR